MSVQARFPWLASAAIVWFALTLPAGFAIWSLAASPAELADPDGFAGSFARALLLGAALAAVAVAAAARLGRLPLLARCAYALGLLYVGVLKVLGPIVAPWIALGLAVAALAFVRRVPQVTAVLLLPPLMGMLAALYFAFTAERWLSGAGTFVAMLNVLSS
jgi:hypothetical protein